MPLLLGTVLVVVAAILLGGAARQGLRSDSIIQLASLILLALLAFRGRFSTFPRVVVVLLAALIVVPLLQLVPLPPSLWTRLPGREPFAATYEQIGMALPYLPLSLNPQATWLAILSLLPPLAVFLATATLDFRARRTISAVFLAFGVISVLLGFAQAMEGPDSTLRLYYPSTSVDNSVGFFANRNHHGAFLYGLVPFVAAWTTGFLMDRRSDRTYGLATCLLVFIALILGFAMAGSRGALFLGVGATAASLLLAAGNERRWGGRNLAILGGAGFVALVLVVQFAFSNILGRIDDGVLDARRWQITETATTAALPFQPTGSGLGTFVEIYKMFETPQELKASYLNHAHNDWLELWLEGGIPFVLLALAFLVWFGVAAYRVWRAPRREGATLDRALGQAGTITIVLLMVHSLADYPMRTATLMTLFAFCAGLLVAPPAAEGESAERGEEQRGQWQRSPEGLRAGKARYQLAMR